MVKHRSVTPRQVQRLWFNEGGVRIDRHFARSKLERDLHVSGCRRFEDRLAAASVLVNEHARVLEQAGA